MKKEKIYVDFKRPRTVKEFLTLYFAPNPTFSNCIRGTITYADPKCKQIQCSANRWRSFDDIYMLIKTYYPSYTVKKTLNAIINFKPSQLVRGEKKEYIFYGLSCSNIRKSTFSYQATGYNFTILGSHKLDSKWSWAELFAKIGIKNQTEYITLMDRIKKTKIMTETKNKTVRFATYGTLRLGQSNHRVISDAKYLGTIKTEPRYKIYTLGGFPAVQEGGDKSIVVDIFETSDPEVIRNVNRLEGYTGIRGDERNWYDTCDVETEWGTAEMFTMNDREFSESSEIISGDWCNKEFKKEEA